MEMRFVVVPPGGGEADYQMGAEIPALPREGDYISIVGAERGYGDSFIVGRVWWSFKEFKRGAGKIELSGDEVVVEIEEAIGLDIEDEKRKRLESKGAKRFETSAY